MFVYATASVIGNKRLNLQFDANYDKSTITYDPSGRIIQLDKAYEIVNKGSSNSIAIKMNEYILILSWTDIHKDNMIKEVPSKLHKLCDHIGILGTGIITDINYLSNICFEMMIKHIKSYDTHPTLRRLSSQLSEFIHDNTNTINKRPYGVSLCLFSYDDNDNDNGDNNNNDDDNSSNGVDRSYRYRSERRRSRAGRGGGSMYLIDPSGNMETRQLCFLG